MLVAAFTKDGRERIVLGLEEENLRRLRDDQPIQREMVGLPGFPDFEIFILGPEDTARFVAQFGPEGPG